MQVIYNPRGRAGEYSKWAINVYNGCTHGCAYCYVPPIMRKSHSEFKAKAFAKVNVVKKLEADLRLHREEIDSPVLFCFTCDAYQPIEKELKITRACLELFMQYEVPFQVLTKGTDLVLRDLDLFVEHSENMFATTLTHTNEDILKKLEPLAASFESRVKALETMHEENVFTWVSLEPVVDVEETLKIIEKTHPVVDHFKVGKLNHDPHEHTINWSDFKKRVVELLEHHGKSYYIKKDLDVF